MYDQNNLSIAISIALSKNKCILIISIAINDSQLLCSYTHLHQTQSRIFFKYKKKKTHDKFKYCMNIWYFDVTNNTQVSEYYLTSLLDRETETLFGFH